MRLEQNFDRLLPQSTVTTHWGWDTDTFRARPRIHYGVDRAGKGLVHLPMRATRLKWIDADAQGISVLRALTDSYELRFFHFIKEELTPRRRPF